MGAVRTAVRMAAPALAAALGGTCALATPAPGHYGAEFCVTTAASAAPGCGPAEVEIRPAGVARVSISDISYRLQLKKSSRVDVVLMHGAMQIDEFTAPYEWVGNALQFADADKRAIYVLRLGERKAAK